MNHPQPAISAALTAVFLTCAPLFAASITIENPSFQAQDFPVFPGYLGGSNPSAITGWATTGGAGINGNDIGAALPFANNGAIPDGSRVAFIQGTGSLGQTVSGLTPGQQYWLQAYVNSRGTPGADGFPAAGVTFNGTTILPTQPVPPAAANGNTGNYYKVNIPFTPTVSSGAIVISSGVFTGSDVALVIDGITLIQRDPSEVVVFNPSFEASGTGLTYPGYLGSIGGWTRTVGANSNTAINTAGGPFSNGFAPEGQSHAVLQNEAALSQQLSGLVIGDTYRLSLDYYGRDGTAPTGLITIDGNTALSGLIPNTGGQLTLSYDFTASSSTPTLSIANLGIGADTSLLFDNISLRSIPEPTGSLLLLSSTGLLLRRSRRKGGR